MPTIKRVHGTEVTSPANGEERIAAVKRIVERKQYAKIDGTMVDLFSASAIVAVYDKLGPENQEKYRNCHVAKMASIAFKLVK